MGPSLNYLVNKFEKLSVITVLKLTIKILSIIEQFHSVGSLHNDIKPDNFLVGLNNPSSLYLVDLGLSRPYETPLTHFHINQESGDAFIGTARYASINVHSGNTSSRRDDMEAIGYLIIWLVNGKLPWQGENYNKSTIYEKKRNYDLKKLCEGLPSCFLNYFEYCRSLKFEEKPNYSKCINMFKKELIFSKISNHEYEWIENSLEIEEFLPEFKECPINERIRKFPIVPEVIVKNGRFSMNQIYSTVLFVSLFFLIYLFNFKF